MVLSSGYHRGFLQRITPWNDENKFHWVNTKYTKVLSPIHSYSNLGKCSRFIDKRDHFMCKIRRNKFNNVIPLKLFVTFMPFCGHLLLPGFKYYCRKNAQNTQKKNKVYSVIWTKVSL